MEGMVKPVSFVEGPQNVHQDPRRRCLSGHGECRGEPDDIEL